MPPRSSPVVLVTGTSSGIGLELAKKLYPSPYRVVATARASSLLRLSENGILENERFMIRPLDITSSRERFDLIREIKARWGGVDILINNAGISYRAVVEHMSEGEEHHQMETNYFGPMALIRQVLPEMRRKFLGKIINVSSVSGMMAMPTMASYSASKFALEGASEALWYELRPWNISVTLVQPGFIRSKSFMNVYYSKTSASCAIDRVDAYCQYYTDIAPFVERLMNRSPTTSEDVANKIIGVMMKKSPPLRVSATWDAQIFYWLRRLLPRTLYHKALYLSLPGAKNWANIVHRSP